ncbi:hypothetical protein JOD01_000596 [Brevibacillus fulvus]|uniref:Uncharacterized protein n=1 Tax=Brevibacillus fulvus TaxID=1125967 RepID=A0A938XWJ7_9BACL|nr:hypothetical protein [Brevibacillus fulvus]
MGAFGDPIGWLIKESFRYAVRLVPGLTRVAGPGSE